MQTDFDDLGRWLRVDNAPKLMVNVLNKAALTVTEVRYDRPMYGMTEMAAQRDSYAVALTLRHHPYHEILVDGRNRPVRDVRVDDMMFYDLSTVSYGYTAFPFHSMFFVLTRAFLDELAEDLESPRLDGLTKISPDPVRDDNLARLSRRILPYVGTPGEVDELYADHFMLAYGIYVCAEYGSLAAHRNDRGCLTRWQERLAKEMIEAHLDGRVRLREIAAMCGLRTSQFAHAFRKGVGVAPYQWLSRRRIERAKSLLRRGRILSDVAQLCGFTDQSHFSRAFRNAEGVTPGYWRSQQ
jgi:AraC-like DNA-binding protein